MILSVTADNKPLQAQTMPNQAPDPYRQFQFFRLACVQDSWLHDPSHKKMKYISEGPLDQVPALSDPIPYQGYEHLFLAPDLLITRFKERTSFLHSSFH